MTGLLCVGAGGALGAMGRYSLGLIRWEASCRS